MKKLLLIVALALISVGTYSQGSLSHGSNQLNLGVGLSDWGIPIYIGFDHGMRNDISLGAEFSYRNYNEHLGAYYYDHNIMGFSGNANYHFNSNE